MRAAILCMGFLMVDAARIVKYGTPLLSTSASPWEMGTEKFLAGLFLAFLVMDTCEWIKKLVSR